MRLYTPTDCFHFLPLCGLELPAGNKPPASSPIFNMVKCRSTLVLMTRCLARQHETLIEGRLPTANLENVVEQTRMLTMCLCLSIQLWHTSRLISLSFYIQYDWNCKDRSIRLQSDFFTVVPALFDYTVSCSAIVARVSTFQGEGTVFRIDIRLAGSLMSFPHLGLFVCSITQNALTATVCILECAQRIYTHEHYII
jgi:hypothetical protein